MIVRKYKKCKMKKISFPHGSEISRDGKLLECVDGRWEPVVLVGGI